MDIERIHRVAEEIGPEGDYTGNGQEILLQAESRCAGVGGKWGGRDIRTRVGRIDAALYSLRSAVSFLEHAEICTTDSGCRRSRAKAKVFIDGATAILNGQTKAAKAMGMTE